MEQLTTTATQWKFTQKILLPFEWLLRSFTYCKCQPMKKKEIIQNTEMAL